MFCKLLLCLHKYPSTVCCEIHILVFQLFFLALEIISKLCGKNGVIERFGYLLGYFYVNSCSLALSGGGESVRRIIFDPAYVCMNLFVFRKPVHNSFVS